MDLPTRIERFRWHPDLVYFYDAWISHIEHFEPEELYSPQSIAQYPWKLDWNAALTLEGFRSYLGSALTVNTYLWGGTRRYAGTRTTMENSAISGARESFHKSGKAFDVMSDEMTTEQLFRRAFRYGKWNGLGLYDTFVHLDTRMLLHGPVLFDGRTSNRKAVHLGTNLLLPGS